MSNFKWIVIYNEVESNITGAHNQSLEISSPISPNCWRSIDEFQIKRIWNLDIACFTINNSLKLSFI